MTYPSDQSIRDVAERHMDVCIICGPGCCAPVLGVHTSCPGPAAGAMMASAQKSDDEEDARWRWAEREIDGGFTGTEFPRLWPPRWRGAVEVPGGES